MLLKYFRFINSHQYSNTYICKYYNIGLTIAITRFTVLSCRKLKKTFHKNIKTPPLASQNFWKSKSFSLFCTRVSCPKNGCPKTAFYSFLTTFYRSPKKAFPQPTIARYITARILINKSRNIVEIFRIFRNILLIP